MLFDFKSVINSKKILFLFLFFSITYLMEENSKIEGEISFGIDTSFGIDGLENTVRLLPPLIYLVRPRVYTDYRKFNTGYFRSARVSNVNLANSNYIPQIHEYYRPSYRGDIRDV
ncbi:hypothetical protein [Streptobacillus moniliformis]|uniref:hypothetical protein n=1 Tax=Streptobacillus moniliformis TaxID=34105 RepID=UPI0007E35F0D|nr:hypothetical protein [Streptobacillus moniliformis]